VSGLRALLEEGAQRSGRSLDGFDMAPTVNAYISDDRELARNLMRPVLALYIGGMGSRDQNFYNKLVQRYGFEDAAREIQDLYLDGKREEAGAAIPDELIDLVSLAGPRDVVRDRLAAFRDGGVGTLMITPMAFNADDRIEQLRAVAELAG
jgi:alkanesulfonate monooxygenase SsuD/methylene tetrahydromethanopterin reductase-like flavin-dependent oxidoreductase (luciferase family)